MQLVPLPRAAGGQFNDLSKSISTVCKAPGHWWKYTTIIIIFLEMYIFFGKYGNCRGCRSMPSQKWGTKYFNQISIKQIASLAKPKPYL